MLTHFETSDCLLNVSIIQSTYLFENTESISKQTLLPGDF